MVTDAQKMLAAKIAADLREWAQAVEDTASDDTDTRAAARRALKGHTYVGGSWRIRRLPEVELETLTVTLFHEACPRCKEGALEDGGPLCWACREATTADLAAEMTPC